MLLIKNGTLHTPSDSQDGILKIQSDIMIENGKITVIAPNLTAPEGCETVDADGLHIFPGFVDAHSHMGLDGTAIGYEGKDYNEYNDPVTPHLRAQDGINPFDPSLKTAALAGVTCIGTGPGSSNPMSANAGTR